MPVIDDGMGPDPAATEAVIQGRMRIGDLGDTDKEWVVADLSAGGWTVAEIARAMGCTPRHVKRMRARPIVQVMVGFLRMRAACQMAESKLADAQAHAVAAGRQRRVAEARAEDLERRLFMSHARRTPPNSPPHN